MSTTTTTTASMKKTTPTPTSTTTGGVKQHSDKEIQAILNRQEYALGKEATQRIMSTGVLLIDGAAPFSCPGLFAEIAKNLILMGVAKLTLHDTGLAELTDLASHFFLTPADLGKPRAAAALSKFRELSFSAQVNLSETKISAADIAAHSVVVLCGGAIEEALALNALCRATATHQPQFIWADLRGVHALIFNDFGESFTVLDSDGENPRNWMVSNVTQDANGGVVSVIEESRFELAVGDSVVFSGMDGMTELMKSEHIVKELSNSKYEFRIATDTSKFSQFGNAGHVTEVKKPQKLSFASLEKSIADPGTIEASDFAKEGRQYLLFLCYRAMWQFASAHGNTLPRIHQDEDADEMVKLVTQLNSALPEKIRLAKIDEAVVRNFAFACRGMLSPMDTFIGGVLCQEVLKACTFKFTPFKQWFFFDAQEVLPDPAHTPRASFQPIGSRYDSQIAVIGMDLQERIEKLRYFLVGAGAIGCEVLKVFAMMGLGVGKEGMIHITDMDVIEKSNISRQFLFREKDIEHLKSEVAAKAVKQMNPAVHITSYALRVGGESENVYNEDFYSSLDGVCTALDNFQARRYVDQQCVTHGKPMIDSGTLGSKGNTQVIMPNLTESYSSSSDPPDKGIPQCTLHHFPNQITHTIEWARDAFQGLFTSNAEAIIGYINKPNFMQDIEAQMGLKVKTLEGLKEDLITQRPSNFADCIRWARLRFEEFFMQNIQKLLFTFPPDALTTEGVQFWHAPKMCPHPIAFSFDDDNHMAFIEAAANLRAFNFGIAQQKVSRADVVEALKNLVIPPYQPAKVTVDTEGAEKAGDKAPLPGSEDDAACEAIKKELPSPETLKGMTIRPVEFEKDNDANYHIAFITACSNMRALNYKIPPADFLQTKLIAGKIIPAMISTTAVVSGLQCLELIKTLHHKDIGAFKNGYVNLALPLFTFSEPIAAPKNTVRPGWTWTLWDHIDIQGEITMQQFIDWFKKEKQLDVSMISVGKTLIYSGFMNSAKRAARMNMTITDVLKEVSGQPLTPGTKALTLVLCVSRLEDDEDVDIPPVRYILPPAH